MIPSPEELIKEAINSGPFGKGRRAPAGSTRRDLERLGRRANVLQDMQRRGKAPRMPQKYRDRERADTKRMAVRARLRPKDTPKAKPRQPGTALMLSPKSSAKAPKSNTGRNVAIGLGTAALAGGAYALYKRKKAKEAKARAEGQKKAK